MTPGGYCRCIEIMVVGNGGVGHVGGVIRPRKGVHP